MDRPMKDSGIEWIGETPSHWKITTIKNLFSVVSGGTPSTSKKEFWENGSVPWATPKDFNNLKSGMLFETDRNITHLGVVGSSAEFIPTNSVILTTRAPVGNVVVNKIKLTTNQGCKSLVNKNNLTDYKYYFFAMKISKDILESISTGTTFLELSGEKLKNFNIMMPPIQEQQKISNFLDGKTAHIDSIITDTKQSIEEFKKYKKAVINEAVTKGLNSNAEMKDSGIEWIGDVPESWSVLNFKSVMYKKKEICQDYDGQNILSLTLNGVIVRDLINPKGKMPTSFDGYQRIEKGNLLLCLFDIDVTPRCVGYAWDDGLTSPAYSQYVMRSNAFARYYEYLLLFLDDQKILLHLTKSLRNTLNDADFGVIKTIQPSYEEQKKIVEYLDQKCAHIENLIQQKQQLITELETYKKSLIYEYVTGKKEVM